MTQLQLENGRSRIYLGIHYGNDDFQGQTLGLSVADAILEDQKDPAVKGVAIFPGNKNVATARNLRDIFVNNSDVSGFYGLYAQDNQEDRDDRRSDRYKVPLGSSVLFTGMSEKVKEPGDFRTLISYAVREEHFENPKRTAYTNQKRRLLHSNCFTTPTSRSISS